MKPLRPPSEVPLIKPVRVLLLGFVAAVAGCARVATTTTISADGSFTRKIVYSVTKSDMGPGAAKKGQPSDLFKIPAAGAGVQVQHSEDKGSISVTTTRQVSAGSPPLQDLALLTDKGVVMVTSTVSVKKLAGGQIEYVEVIHSTGQMKPSMNDFAVADLRARVKKVIPAEYQKTETIDQVTKSVTLNLMHAVFGPPEPTLFDFFVSPDAAARKVNGHAFAANVATFKSAMPGLTDDQARTMARSLPNLLNQEALSESNAASQAQAPKEDSNTNDASPLFFVVSFPGKVVETNGLTDPMTGEVYWSLMPMSLVLADVELRLVVQP